MAIDFFEYSCILKREESFSLSCFAREGTSGEGDLIDIHNCAPDEFCGFDLLRLAGGLYHHAQPALAGRLVRRPDAVGAGEHFCPYPPGYFFEPRARFSAPLVAGAFPHLAP